MVHLVVLACVLGGEEVQFSRKKCNPADKILATPMHTSHSDNMDKYMHGRTVLYTV